MGRNIKSQPGKIVWTNKQLQLPRNYVERQNDTGALQLAHGKSGKSQEPRSEHGNFRKRRSHVDCSHKPKRRLRMKTHLTEAQPNLRDAVGYQGQNKVAAYA